jgi:hypothetical protein
MLGGGNKGNKNVGEGNILEGLGLALAEVSNCRRHKVYLQCTMGDVDKGVSKLADFMASVSDSLATVAMQMLTKVIIMASLKHPLCVNHSVNQMY